MTSEARLESLLRSVLAEQRPANGTPPGLRERVAAIPENHGSRPWFMPPWLGRLAPIGASIASVAAVLVILAIASHGPAIAPGPGGGSGPPPTVTTFDPTLEGPGLLTDVLPTTEIARWALATLAVVVLARFLIGGSERRTRRGKIVALVVLAAALLLVGRVGPEAGLSRGSAGAVLLGYDVDDAAANPPGASSPYALYYENAAASQPTAIMFSVRNNGPVAIRIEGVVVPRVSEGYVPAHWIAAWLPPAGRDYEIVPLEQVQRFTPTVVEPDHELDIYLVGRAGPCAYGPAFKRTTTGDATFTTLGPTFTVAYSIAGLVSTVDIDTQMAFSEPQRTGCPASS